MAIVEDFLSARATRATGKTTNKNIGIGGFILGVRTTEDVTRTLAVPSTPLEDGSFVNDHIIENALQIKLSGEVSNVMYEPSAFQDLYKRSVGIVGDVTQYLPQRTRSQANKVFELANDARQIGRRIDSVVKSGEQVLDLFKNTVDNKKAPELFIDRMEELQLGKQVVSISVHGRVYENMVITSVVTTKNNETGESLTYALVAQQIRYAQILFVKVSRKKNPSTGTNGQTDGAKNKGLNKVKVETSFLDNLQSAYRPVMGGSK